MSGRHLGEGREGEVEGRGMYKRSRREGVGVGNCLNYVYIYDCCSFVLQTYCIAWRKEEESWRVVVSVFFSECLPPPPPLPLTSPCLWIAPLLMMSHQSSDVAKTNVCKPLTR